MTVDQELFDALKNVPLFKYTDVSPTTLLVYDYFLTLNEERVLFWESKWSLGKILFLLNRYSPMFDSPFFLTFRFDPDINPNTCKILYKVQAWLYITGILISEMVLVFRTTALYNNSIPIVWSLGILLIILVVLSAVVLIIFLNSLVFTSAPSGNIHTSGCLITGGSTILFLAFVAVTLFECAIVVLTFRRIVQMRRTTRSPLITTIFRDGLPFFVYLAALSLLNVVLLATGGEQGTVLVTLYRNMHSILSSRILINLRRSALITQKSSPPPPDGHRANVASTVMDPTSPGAWTMSVGIQNNQLFSETSMMFSTDRGQGEDLLEGGSRDLQGRETYELLSMKSPGPAR